MERVREEIRKCRESGAVRLNLSSNQLTAVPPELGQLTALRTLTLHSNQLTAVPPELGQLTALQDLNLNSNPLLLHPPPEIIRRGLKAIQTYLCEAPALISSHRAKLLVMGEGNIGKTCLLRRLVSDEYVEQTMTDGIQVQEWQLDEDLFTGTVSTWDFGGQEIYLNSHQFFLTDRCVYLLVRNGRDDVHEKAVKWLHQLAARVPNAMVVVVATRQDEVAGATHRPVPRDALRERGLEKLIVHETELWVSSLTGHNIPDLKNLLLKQLLKQPMTCAQYPRDWVEFASHLGGVREKFVGPVALEELIDYAVKHCSVSRGLASLMVETMHDWGVFVRYTRGDHVFVIVEPQWLHDRFAEVVTATAAGVAALDIQHGIVRDEQLRALPKWEIMTRSARDDVISLLQEFEIMLPAFTEHLDGVEQQRWLVPAHLPDDRPEGFHAEMNELSGTLVVYRVQLSFFPTGLFAWLVVRLRATLALAGRDCVRALYKTGVALYDARTGTRGVVYADRDYVYVRVRGREPWDLGRNVVDVLLNLAAARFKGLDTNSFVRCPSEKCASVESSVTAQVFFSLEVLRECLEEGLQALMCHSCKKLINVALLLTGEYSPPQMTHANSKTEQDLLLTQGVDRMCRIEDYVRDLHHELTGGPVSTDAALTPDLYAAIDVLNTVSAPPEQSLRQRILGMLEQLQQGQTDIFAVASASEQYLVRVMQEMKRLHDKADRTFRSLLDRDANTPRVFFITQRCCPDKAKETKRLHLPTLKKTFKLHLCCEYSDHVHCTREYSIRLTKKALRKFAGPLRTVLKFAAPLLKFAVGTSVTAAGFPEFKTLAANLASMLSSDLRAALQDDSSFERLTQLADGNDESDHDLRDTGNNDMYRELEAFILQQDPQRQWGLEKVTLTDGKTAFLCPEHAKALKAFTISNLTM